ncbi:CDP-2,3-bis-(O-geranylgeranyl)-sn-glycerol synthase [Candidatus Woesearchaeota archaeon]|nr:CDP-2,3-bis-(O-geranylgeranyl)-sn-glycerol synthase [Candidatus Woesearchaeota archaeon]
MTLILLILQTIYFMVPAYFANMAPVVTKNIFKKLAIPVDFNKKLGGKPIFGSHKTIRGLIMATIFGIIFFQIQKWLYVIPFFQKISLINYSEYSILLGFLLGFGAIIGDLVESFFKRRVNRKPGSPWIPFDQLDYTIGALLFASIVYLPSWQVIVAAIIINFFLHIIANHITYYLGITKVKW